MKRIILFGSALAMVLAMTSCKSSESAYKKAYEKAQAAQATQTTQTVVGTTQQQTPVQVTPVTPQQQTPVTTTDYSNVSVRTEAVTLVSGAGLKAFSVVVGSFSVKANAEGLCQQLRNAGHSAQIAYNSARNMYRVIASTSDDKATAVRSRNEFRSKYPDAWLLFNQR